MKNLSVEIGLNMIACVMRVVKKKTLNKVSVLIILISKDNSD